MTRPDVETCSHADTTTNSWLYGEGPEDHVHHVAACAACTAVAAEHAEVMAAVGPALGGLQEATVPAVVAADAVAPRAANRPWLLGALLVAAAAVALLLVWPAADPPVVPPDAPDVVVVDDATTPAPTIDDLVDEFVPDAVIAEFEALSVPALDTGAPDAQGQVAELDLLDLSIADEPFDAGFDSLLDDFAALEADLATL